MTRHTRRPAERATPNDTIRKLLARLPAQHAQNLRQLLAPEANRRDDAGWPSVLVLTTNTLTIKQSCM